MISLLSNGYSLRQVGDKYGLSGERVRQIVLPFKSQRGICSGKDITKECFAEAIKDCTSLEKVRKELGVTWHALKVLSELYTIELPSQEELRYRRFLNRVEKCTDGCWVWKGGFSGNKTSYVGTARLSSSEYVRPYVYKKFFGEYDPKLTPLPSCNNKRCVSPSHLQLGKRAYRYGYQFV